MSTFGTEVDERLWELYLMDCRAHASHPSIKDYLVWLEDQDYDTDEVDHE